MAEKIEPGKLMQLGIAKKIIERSKGGENISTLQVV